MGGRLREEIRLRLEELNISTIEDYNRIKDEIRLHELHLSSWLYSKVRKYIEANDLVTHIRYSAGGRKGGGVPYEYTVHFKFVGWGKLSSAGSRGIASIDRLNRCYELTPTLAQIMYNTIKKYPQHLINIHVFSKEEAYEHLRKGRERSAEWDIYYAENKEQFEEEDRLYYAECRAKSNTPPTAQELEEQAKEARLQREEQQHKDVLAKERETYLKR